VRPAGHQFHHTGTSEHCVRHCCKICLSTDNNKCPITCVILPLFLWVHLHSQLKGWTHTLRMTENKVLRRIFEQNNKRDAVTRHTRKLHYVSQNLYTSSCTVLLGLTSRWTRLVVHVASTGVMIRFNWNLKGTRGFEDLGVDGRIMLVNEFPFPFPLRSVLGEYEAKSTVL
jgi:hypothetical protein